MRKPDKSFQWKFVFIVILLITANARFIGIEKFPLSTEEAALYFLAIESTSEILLSFSFATSESSPLFTLLLHFWINLWGNSESALRSLPAIFSFITLVPFLGIANKLFSKSISYLALALYAISPLSTVYAQNLSPNTMFLFFSVTSTWALIHSMIHKSPVFRVLYTACFIGAIFSNPSAWFLLAFHSIFFLGSYFNHSSGEFGLRQWLTTIISIGLIASLSFPSYLPEVGSQLSVHWWSPFTTFLLYLRQVSGSTFIVIPVAILLIILLINKNAHQFRILNMAGSIHFVFIWLIMVAIPPFLFHYEENQLGRSNGGIASIFPLFLLLSISINTITRTRYRNAIFLSIFTLSLFTIYLNSIHKSVPWLKITSIDPSKTGIIAVGNDLISPLKYYSTLNEQENLLILASSALNSQNTQNDILKFSRHFDRIILLISAESKGTLVKSYLSTHNLTVDDKTYQDRWWSSFHEKPVRIITFAKYKEDL